MKHKKHAEFMHGMLASMMEDSAFEPEEVARFVSFTMDYMELDDDEEKLDWLRNSEDCIKGNAVVLAKLMDEFDGFEIPLDDLVSMLLTGSRDGIIVLEDAFEQGLIDVKEESSIDLLTYSIWDYDAVGTDVTQLARYFRAVGCHCGSKKLLGRYFDSYRLRFWTLEDGDEENGFQVIYETIKGEFFLDLTGGLDNFLRGFGLDGGAKYADELEQYLKDRGLNEDGAVVDSDEDSQGNLAGFVEDDDGTGTEDEDGEGSDSEEVDDSDAEEVSKEEKHSSQKRKIKSEDDEEDEDEDEGEDGESSDSEEVDDSDAEEESKEEKDGEGGESDNETVEEEEEEENVPVTKKRKIKAELSDY